jgi:hypothetical protein
MRYICDRIKNTHRVLVGKPKTDNLKYRRRWHYSIKNDIEEVGWKAVEWISLNKNRDTWWVLVNAVMILQVPCNVENFLTS